MKYEQANQKAIRDKQKSTNMAIAICIVGAVIAWDKISDTFDSKPEKAKTPPADQIAKSPPSTPKVNLWYEGGTLHTASLKEWSEASDANKLATAADWLAATIWKGHINNAEQLKQSRVAAERLAHAVDDVASENRLGDLNAGEIAATLITVSNDLGPHSVQRPR